MARSQPRPPEGAIPLKTPYLSVLIPALNEGRTLNAVIDAVLAVDVPLELILVDDGSTDDTWRLMQARADGVRVRAFQHTKNQGKGAAIRTALREARGEVVIIQDADLEYNPNDYARLIEPIRRGKATVVYGSRAFASHTAYSFWYVMGNKGVTTVANMIYNSYISDLETCFKLMPLPLYRSLNIHSAGFGMEAEVTAKLLRRRIRPYEVPISYRARTREEGKKITWKDGVEALWILTRERVRRRGTPARYGSSGSGPRKTAR